MASITFWLLLYLLVSEFLAGFLSYETIDRIGAVLIVLIFVVSLIGMLFTQTKLKNSKFADRFGYTITMGFGQVLYLFGFKAFTYITQTIRTNVKGKLFFIGMMSLIMLSMVGALPRFLKLAPYFHADI